jgi:uncharacterized membrane protein
MVEIIPNWHPFIVHFAIALLLVSTLFHIVAVLNSKSTNYYQFENVANWNLWVGTVFALMAVTAGWFASNSVEHDAPAHLAMMDHRNWALATTAFFVVLAIWSLQRARKAYPISWLMILPLIVASGLLGTTGWKGGELVYRHGLGVMALPDVTEHDHSQHSHDGDNQIDNDASNMPQEDQSEEAEHEVGEKAHAHEDEQNDPESKASGSDTEGKQTSEDHHDHSDHAH